MSESWGFVIVMCVLSLLHVHVWVCMCARVYVCVCQYVSVSIEWIMRIWWVWQFVFPLSCMYVCVCVCVCVYVCVCVCQYVYVALSGSLEWVLCCLDVVSVVRSLSRCCIFSQYILYFMSESWGFDECDCLHVCVFSLSIMSVCVCVCVCVRVSVYVCSIEWILCCLYVASIVSVSPLLVHSFTLTLHLSLAPHPFLFSLRFCLCSLYYCYAVFILSLPGRMPHEAALLRWSHEYYNHLYTSSKIESVYSHSSLWYIYMHASILCLLVKVHVYHFTFLCYTMQVVKGCVILYVEKKKPFLEVSPVPYCISLLHVSWYLHCRVYFISMIWFHVFQRNHPESPAIKYSKIKLA